MAGGVALAGAINGAGTEACGSCGGSTMVGLELLAPVFSAGPKPIAPPGATAGA
jgi:hypothetical protein